MLRRRRPHPRTACKIQISSNGQQPGRDERVLSACTCWCIRIRGTRTGTIKEPDRPETLRDLTRGDRCRPGPLPWQSRLGSASCSTRFCREPLLSCRNVRRSEVRQLRHTCLIASVHQGKAGTGEDFKDCYMICRSCDLDPGIEQPGAGRGGPSGHSLEGLAGKWPSEEGCAALAACIVDAEGCSWLHHGCHGNDCQQEQAGTGSSRCHGEARERDWWSLSRECCCWIARWL